MLTFLIEFLMIWLCLRFITKRTKKWIHLIPTVIILGIVIPVLVYFGIGMYAEKFMQNSDFNADIFIKFLFRDVMFAWIFGLFQIIDIVKPKKLARKKEKNDLMIRELQEKFKDPEG